MRTDRRDSRETSDTTANEEPARWRFVSRVVAHSIRFFLQISGVHSVTHDLNSKHRNENPHAAPAPAGSLDDPRHRLPRVLMATKVAVVGRSEITPLANDKVSKLRRLRWHAHDANADGPAQAAVGTTRAAPALAPARARARKSQGPTGEDPRSLDQRLSEESSQVKSRE